jgi:putative two-component system response regulator
MQAIIADDDELSLEIMSNLLQQMGYTVEHARNGREALQLLSTTSAHLVITDWQMPELTGLELCRHIRARDFNGYVYIIMVTAQDTPESKIEGLHAGADAFLTKPLNSAELLVCLRTAERILSLETRDLAIFALAKLAESRDPETGAHIERVQSYSRLLAQELCHLGKYHGIIDPEFIRLIYQTSPLHDIGKVGIPDPVLLKRGKLNHTEFEVMKTHAELGAQTLDAALQRFPNAKFLQMARDIALTHHEKFDGTGYPNRLVGSQIPLCGRIVALADVYDALTSRRVYKAAMSHHNARNIIFEERGRHFDPDIVDAFIQCEKQFIAIGDQLKDADEEQIPLTVPSAAPVDKSPDTVLLVDDDPEQLEALRTMVEQGGYAVLTATDGEEALHVLAEHRPRLILADWAMPRMDGLSMCRSIRAMNDSQYVHIVLMTVHAKKCGLIEAFDAGVDDFLTKPVAELDLLASIRAGFRAVALHDDLLRRSRGSDALNVQLSGLNNRLEKLAITDDLTGLYNRRHAMIRLEEHWALADRYRRPLSVFVVDIDHFKEINDTYGHAAGDAILQQVSGILRQNTRATDIVCRIGGEEFLVVCPSETAYEAAVCAERCREAVAQYSFRIGQKTIRVTISIGVSTKRPELKQCSDLLREADEALYDAKRSGRDAVSVAEQCAALMR